MSMFTEDALFYPHHAAGTSSVAVSGTPIDLTTLPAFDSIIFISGITTGQSPSVTTFYVQTGTVTTSMTPLGGSTITLGASDSIAQVAVIEVAKSKLAGQRYVEMTVNGGTDTITYTPMVAILNRAHKDPVGADTINQVTGSPLRVF